jgi:hypothetical protein
MGNRNRATERNRAGCVSVVHSFLAAFHVASYFGRRRRLLLGLDCWFVGMASEPLAAAVAHRTSLAYFVGALAVQCIMADGEVVVKTLLHTYTSFLYIRNVRHQSQSTPATLFETAEGQQGYFTAKQAAAAGYLLGSQAHHVKAGNWVRLERGVYRLARFPQSSEEQLVIYALWSRNLAGEPQGVYSHQTALSIHELSDVNPAKLHMTVPPIFRRSTKVPKILVLHRALLDKKDVEQRQGFIVTRPLRAIADLAAAESVSRDIITQALTEGRERGLISVRETSELRRQKQLAPWFDELLVKNKR